jgi:hypothetical protein
MKRSLSWTAATLHGTTTAVKHDKESQTAEKQRSGSLDRFSQAFL